MRSHSSMCMSGMRACKAESVVAAAERPDVHVVHFVDAFDGEHGAGHFFDAHFARTALEKKCADSRRMPMLDQRTRMPMARPRSGSIQCSPVLRSRWRRR